MLLFRFELTCGSSRLWGGVHFVDAVEEGNRIGNEIGKIAVNFVRKHINPQNPPVGPVVGPLARQPKSAPLRQRQQSTPQSAPLRATAAPTAAAPTGPAFAHGLPANVSPYHHTAHQTLLPVAPHPVYIP